MIKPTTMHMVVCDRCGGYFTNGKGIGAYEDKDMIEPEALDSEWIKIDSKHYCPDCYEYDEESDDYKPKVKEITK